MKRIKKEIDYVYAVFRQKLHLLTVYRLKLLVWVVSGVVEPVVWSALWFVTAQTSDSLPMTGAEVLTYYLLIALVSRVTRTWTFETIKKDIVHGWYSKYLLWPRGVVGYRMGADIADKAISVFALLPLWIIWLAVLLNKGLLQLSFSNIPLFLLGLILAVAIRFYMDLVLGHIVLWTGRAEGIGVVYNAVSKLLGGMTVPLLLLPPLLFGLTAVLPFRYIYSFPVELFLGSVQGSEIIYGFAVGLSWLTAELIMLRFILKHGLKRYEAAGI